MTQHGDSIQPDQRKTFGGGYDLLSTYRPLLMGVQIVLIIFFHITSTCKSSNVRFDGFIELFYTYIRSSGVDMFLLLSGLGLYYSWKRNPDRATFYRKRFARLLIPYLIVAVPSWIIYYCMTGTGSPLRFVADLCFVTMFTDGTIWLWYVFMAAVCYLIFPYLFTVVETARDRVDEVMRIMVLTMAVVGVLVLFKLYQPDLYGSISVMVSRFPAFFVGVLLGKWAHQRRPVSVPGTVVLLAAAVVANCFLHMASVSILGVYTRALMNYALCMAGVLLLNALHHGSRAGAAVEHGLNRFFSWLGRYTLELYMLHVVIRTFLGRAGLPVYRISSICIMVAGSLVLSLLLSRVSGVLIRRVTATTRGVPGRGL